ncbi:hypothetical protein BKA62DRAFT_706170 [Auriculariales sp. MPI-PUGE-AT-0066]|nr:hypothetical protein BKA62DRAFT_706170 [Auriculariales sp. MPI-PUGE-AT-0066]
MSSPTPAPQSPVLASERAVSPSERDSIADAIARRAPSTRIQQSQYDSERDARQTFRRQIGAINRSDARKARACFDLLLKICDNIIREPENTKFHSFKPTNTIIKRDLVEVKGGVEYAILLGFRANVRDFQPLYEWSPRHIDELRIGADMIREDLELQDEKKFQSEAASVANKHAAKEAADKVKLQYEEDRRKKAERDRMEKERRIHAIASPLPAATPTRTTPSSIINPLSQIRSEGQTLSGDVAPPPYGADTAHADDAADDDSDGSSDAERGEFDGLQGGRRLGD